MKLDCYIVRDLLPSYIEDLTSEESEEDVKEHLAGCEDCRTIYEAMSNEIDREKGERQFKENLDYLGKIKKIYFAKVVSAIFVLLFVLQRFVRAYMGDISLILFETEIYVLLVTLMCWYICKDLFHMGSGGKRGVFVLQGVLFLLSAVSAVWMFWMLGATKLQLNQLVEFAGGGSQAGRRISGILIWAMICVFWITVYGVYASVIKSEKYFGLVGHGLGSLMMLVHFLYAIRSLSLPLGYSYSQQFDLFWPMFSPYLVGTGVSLCYCVYLWKKYPCARSAGEL